MPKKTHDVEGFLRNLEHPRKKEILAVREIILGANKAITEHIKWNAPSFCYEGEDRVTFKLHPQDRIQLIFHRGAKVKNSMDFAFEDSTGLMEKLAADRGMVTLHDMKDVNAGKAALTKLVREWIKATTS